MKWGRGAWYCTVIGEMAAGILCLLYLRRLQSVQLEKGALRPTWTVTKMILQLGFPSLLTQGLTALVQIVLNNLMRVYGEASIYGSDMALSVYGMMMKFISLRIPCLWVFPPPFSRLTAITSERRIISVCARLIDWPLALQSLFQLYGGWFIWYFQDR